MWPPLRSLQHELTSVFRTGAGHAEGLAPSGKWDRSAKTFGARHVRRRRACRCCSSVSALQDGPKASYPFPGTVQLLAAAQPLSGCCSRRELGRMWRTRIGDTLPGPGGETKPQGNSSRQLARASLLIMAVRPLTGAWVYQNGQLRGPGRRLALCQRTTTIASVSPRMKPAAGHDLNGLCGADRRRLPQWHDLGRPAVTYTEGDDASGSGSCRTA
jgi:hypothetical protein